VGKNSSYITLSLKGYWRNVGLLLTAAYIFVRVSRGLTDGEGYIRGGFLSEIKKALQNKP